MKNFSLTQMNGLLMVNLSNCNINPNIITSFINTDIKINFQIKKKLL